MSHKRTADEIESVVRRLGFKLRDVAYTRAGHYKCRVVDDAGNEFKAVTGSTCSSNARRALLNFKRDIRRASNKAKGLT